MAVIPIIPGQLAAQVKQPDAELIALGRQFDDLAELVDRTGYITDVYAQFDAVEKAIVTQEATTMAGLSVKARAACWAVLGDFDPLNQPTTDRRMAMSIIRDLIRIHAPHLEQPGALERLVAEATGGTAQAIPPTNPSVLSS